MPDSRRPRMVIGNWKMYKTHSEAERYLTDFIPHIKDSTVEIYLAMPYTLIDLGVRLTKGTSIAIGAQNMNDASEGAFTGEIAARMLVDAGASFVILGHSERRTLFHESDSMINRKVKKALQSNLRPVLCVGESLAEREAGKTHEILEQQLKNGLADVSIDHLSQAILAYEPVWAIGTGETATPQVAEEAHRFIRQLIESLWGVDLAQRQILLYGGSVRLANVPALMEQPDIDGLLVGGASLLPDSFAQIINAIHTLPIGKET